MAGRSSPLTADAQPELVYVSKVATAYVVTTASQWDTACDLLLSAMGETNVLGLDVEYLPQQQALCPDRQAHVSSPCNDVRRRNVVRGRDPLLQLAAPGVAVLLRLCYFEQMPKSLLQLLDNRNIVFVGVEIVDDVQRLAAQWQLHVRSCLDVRHVCLSSQKFIEKYHFAKFNLKSIGAFLRQDIDDDRDWRLAASDWSAPKLSFKQVSYAARDALAGVGIYIRLVTHFLPHPALTGADFWRHWATAYRSLVNRPFREHNLDKLRGKLKADVPPQDDKPNITDMKPKAFRKLAEARHCSDSDVDMDVVAERDRLAEKMGRREPELLHFPVDNGGSVGVVVERELLDWIAESEVDRVKMTMLSKVSGEWKRYGVTLAVERFVDQDK